MADASRTLRLHGKRIVLVGTAHVSADSIEEVVSAIREENPDQVCVEIDAGRFALEQSQADGLPHRVDDEQRGFFVR